MEDILKIISEHAKERVAKSKLNEPLNKLRAVAECMPKGYFPFQIALEKEGLSLICEVKKASPSKGVIAEDFPYVEIAMDYDAGGADAISVLTEPKWFLGSDEYLREIYENVKIPVLRKDFTVDPYMIYEAKIMGAGAILLICSILDEKELNEYLTIAHSVGLSCLVEAHDVVEIEMAVKAGAKIIGVNNRNLRDFSVDTGNAGRLRSLVPKDVSFVSESGFMSVEQVKEAANSGIDAVLIGEFLMRSKDRVSLLKQLKAKVTENNGQD